jgi:hypothetical protein
MQQSLKLGGTNYHFKLVKVQNVAGTAPYWKAWTQGQAQGHLNITHHYRTPDFRVKQLLSIFTHTLFW